MGADEPAAATEAMRAWRLEPAAVAHALGTDAQMGLSGAVSGQRLLEYGPNELIKKKQRPTWMLLLDQFSSPMILVLIAAAVVTALIGETKDTVVILAIVLFNGVVGFVQEYRAEQAMDALKKMSSPDARVLRDGEVVLLPAARVVPGDIVLLEQGDIVTADMRLLEAPGLKIDEAPLTGESEPVSKVTEPLPEVDASTPADQRNMAFSGTAVTYGRARGLVVATGMSTAIGRIAELLQEGEDDPTPLQQRLGQLGKWLAIAAIVICALVFGLGVARGEPAEEMFLIAVSLAVAAIPEGLPAVVTISLALGAHRMAARRALVRRLPAVETLGSVTVICTDKTGTLTENRMLVERLWTPAGQYQVGGDGYSPDGSLEPSAEGDILALRAAHVAAACNDATLVPPDGGGEWSITGDPTEGALVAFAAKLGVRQKDVAVYCPRVAEISFDSERRRMTTVHQAGDCELEMEEPHWVAVKGALESIAPLLSHDQTAALEEARTVADRFAQDGYRVLALAEAGIDQVPEDTEEAEQGLRLVGIVAMADPPRDAAAMAIAQSRSAGISPVMITGDHQLTATSIARRLGMLDESRESITGAELAQISDEELVDRVVRIGVYARTNPEQKLRIVDAWRDRGAVVAMTGDGVNDAPALRKADIGVAMGITGTDVSKEASDMILEDDDFSTIVAAVEEGRRIYSNIRRFVRYLLTTNSAEIWVMVAAPFLGLPLPLLAIQILWINLVTDGAPALSLGVEPAHPRAMRQPPRDPEASILGDGLWQHAVWVGLLMAGIVLGLQAWSYHGGASEESWRTVVFTALAFLQLSHALVVRSERESVFKLGFGTNRPLLLVIIGSVLVQLALIYVPALQPIFETTALTPMELGLVLLVTPVPFIVVEIEKLLRRRREDRVPVAA
ncbi:MAG TPA: cation-translocating P-type ATPase [Anaerolineae bacterium]|nr:cation-translocating P-type ATPase [Anaerolineae bacterium]